MDFQTMTQRACEVRAGYAQLAEDRQGRRRIAMDDLDGWLQEQNGGGR